MLMIEKRASYLRNRGDLIWTHYWSVWVVEPVVGCCYYVLHRFHSIVVAVVVVAVVVSWDEGTCCYRNLYCWHCQWVIRFPEVLADYYCPFQVRYLHLSWLASRDFRTAFYDWHDRCSTFRTLDRQSSPIRKAIRLRRTLPATFSGF